MSANLSKQWLERASEDLAVATLVFGENHLSHACFLAQQCIEKCLKAYLLNKSNTYPRTHKLIDLLSECESLDPTFSQFNPDCLIVDQYYIPTRYPNGVPAGTLGHTEAQEAIEAANSILQFVIARLP